MNNSTTASLALFKTAVIVPFFKRDMPALKREGQVRFENSSLPALTGSNLAVS